MSRKEITAEDIDSMTHNPEYNGFGYLGHKLRCSGSDASLYIAANWLKLPLENVFLWANSSYGRHFMDQYHDRNLIAPDFMKELEDKLPLLKLELIACQASEATQGEAI